jgi:hypothetical protein
MFFYRLAQDGEEADSGEAACDQGRADPPKYERRIRTLGVWFESVVLFHRWVFNKKEPLMVWDPRPS